MFVVRRDFPKQLVNNLHGIVFYIYVISPIDIGIIIHPAIKHYPTLFLRYTRPFRSSDLPVLFSHIHVIHPFTPDAKLRTHSSKLNLQL